MDPAKTMPSTMRSRGDYGLKIAKKGFDVLFAADNQLLYSSSFPVLQIVTYLTAATVWEITETGSYTSWSDFNGATSTRYKHKMRKIHGLGHPPMIVPLFAGGWASPNRFLTWNEKYIYYERDFNNVTEYNDFINGGSVTGDFVVFNVDISTDVEYPYTDLGLDTEWGQIYDYGIKHLLTDDINTSNPLDLGLNANVQSMLVVAVKIATSDKVNINQYMPDGISTDLLSPFCFIMGTNRRWRAGGISAQAVSGYRPALPSAGINYYTLDGQIFAPKCSLVLVRSPMIAADKTTASFNM